MKNSSSSSSGSAAAGAFAGHALLALRVEAPPPHAAAQVLLADRAEPAGREDPVDALAHVQAVVFLLDLLRGVERLVVAQRPLTLAALAGGRSSVRGCRSSWPRRCVPGNGKAASRRPGWCGKKGGLGPHAGCRLPGHRAAPCDSTGVRASWRPPGRRCVCGSRFPISHGRNCRCKTVSALAPGVSRRRRLHAPVATVCGDEQRGLRRRFVVRSRPRSGARGRRLADAARPRGARAPPSAPRGTGCPCRPRARQATTCSCARSLRSWTSAAMISGKAVRQAADGADRAPRHPFQDQRLRSR